MTKASKDGNTKKSVEIGKHNHENLKTLVDKTFFADI